MRIEKIKTISSTNQKAKELAQKGAEPWTVVVADEQTAGYGKEKVSWFSPKGGLYFSIILPKSQIEDLQTLTVLAAFIIAKTIKNNFSLEPLIKLPNDVLIKQKKVAGILTENIIGKEIKTSVMGIGLNTNIDRFPEELEKIATSLKIESGKEVDNKKILEQILKELKEQLKTISQ
jgi:BirA family biotin operon repressor/biotin-[acetyl-CoA-carboxylase] ligase